MSQVTIYQFTLYDVSNDTVCTSRRWGTKEAIQVIAKGTVLLDTAIQVDESLVKSDIVGMTERDFNPHWNQGFQRTVR